MRNQYFTNDGKTYATRDGYNDENGKTLFCVHYYGDPYGVYEEHEIKYYDWARRPHGNAPSGTPYGYFTATKTRTRVIITV